MRPVQISATPASAAHPENGSPACTCTNTNPSACQTAPRDTLIRTRSCNVAACTTFCARHACSECLSGWTPPEMCDPHDVSVLPPPTLSHATHAVILHGNPHSTASLAHQPGKLTGQLCKTQCISRSGGMHPSVSALCCHWTLSEEALGGP